MNNAPLNDEQLKAKMFGRSRRCRQKLGAHANKSMSENSHETESRLATQIGSRTLIAADLMRATIASC